MYKNIVFFDNGDNNVCDSVEQCEIFSSLTVAKMYARMYDNAYVYRVYFDKKSGDILYLKEFKKL